MAYPSGVAFKFTEAPVGTQPIHEASATQKHPLGMIVSAKDTTYGEGEFVYLLGAASVAQGDFCTYESKTGAMTRGSSASLGLGCVAASANTAGLYGWAQIGGACPVKAGTIGGAGTAVYLSSTAAQLGDTWLSDGTLLDGATWAGTDSSGYATIQLSRPSVVPAGGQATLDPAQGRYVVLSAAEESGSAIVVSGQVTDINGTAVSEATLVVVRTRAVTDGKGDITVVAVTGGTEFKTTNPATGENVCYLTSNADGTFAVSVANDVEEATVITATPAGGLTSMLELSFVDPP